MLLGGGKSAKVHFFKGTQDIHLFAKEYLLSWFPKLPSYQTFNYHLNLMPEAIRKLAENLIDSFKPSNCDFTTSPIGSMPITTCAGRNKTGKVVTEITSKGYCSTKSMYYYGMKLHALAFRREGSIPFPEQLILSKAKENDLAVLNNSGEKS